LHAGDIAMGVFGVMGILGIQGGMVVGIWSDDMDDFCCLYLKRW